MIKTAHIIAGAAGRVMISVANQNLPEDPIALSFQVGGFKLYQGPRQIADITNLPESTAFTLRAALGLVLVEMGPDGPARIHENISVQADA